MFNGCTKEEALSPIEQNKIYLTGLGATPTKWLLTSLTTSVSTLPFNICTKTIFTNLCKKWFLQ